MARAEVDPALEPERGPLHHLVSHGHEPEPLPEAEGEADAEPEPEAG